MLPTDMSNDFFEGADFENQPFKALKPEFYPPLYAAYIKEEEQLLREKIAGSGIVLEAGVGTGRLIPVVAPLVHTLVGIDIADRMLLEAKSVAELHQNVEILKCDISSVAQTFPSHHFDYTLCMWNTLGNVENEVDVLKMLASVTKKSIIMTVFRKGTIEQRRQFYARVGISIASFEQDETFFTTSGLRSRAYSESDIRELAACAHLTVRKLEVLLGVMIYAELEISS